MEWEVWASYDYDHWYVYGSTPITYQQTSPYRILAAESWFNLAISWNESEQYDCWSIPVYPNNACEADARNVTLHELGHGEGLGHVEDGVTAIMKQGGVTWHTLRPDDENGIVAIYGAYP